MKSAHNIATEKTRERAKTERHPADAGQDILKRQGWSPTTKKNRATKEETMTGEERMTVKQPKKKKGRGQSSRGEGEESAERGARPSRTTRD